MPATNQYGEPFKICRMCEIPHAENCVKCWGWGLYRYVRIAVSARDAHDGHFPFGERMPCPECGGTEHGFKEESNDGGVDVPGGDRGRMDLPNRPRVG